MKWSEYIRRWKDQGWAIEKTNGGHLRLTHPDTPEVVFAPSTPSDHRAGLNTEARLKRLLRSTVVPVVETRGPSQHPAPRRTPRPTPASVPVPADRPTPLPPRTYDPSRARHPSVMYADQAPRPTLTAPELQPAPKTTEQPKVHVLNMSLEQALAHARGEAPQQSPAAPPPPRIRKAKWTRTQITPEQSAPAPIPQVVPSTPPPQIARQRAPRALDRHLRPAFWERRAAERRAARKQARIAKMT